MFSSDTTQVSDGGYQISRSLRFNSADSAYLNRTPASATNRKTWTWSGWVKRSALNSSGESALFIVGTSLAEGTYFNIAFSSDKFVCGSGAAEFRRTTAVYRDVSAWYHLVVAVDTTQATAANRVKMYVNGVEATAFDTNANPTQNTDLAINSTVTHNIGRNSFNSSNFFSGYMTEVNFIDGQALTPSSFGETNAQTGVWQPKAYSGSYGTNGFYLNFSDNSNTTAATLGKDYSGNGNNWTPNNFSVTAGAGNDSLVDSPTSYGTDTGVGGTVRGNYCTLNPLDAGPNISASNGNLDVIASTQWRGMRATLGMQSGKWYCEYTPTSGTYHIVSVSQPQATTDGYIVNNATAWGYQWDGNKITNNTTSAYGSAWGVGDTIGIAFDADAGTLVFYKNGVSQGTAFSGLTSGPYLVGIGTYPSATGTFNFGQRPFAYTAPSGYKALCTQNLPTPTIGATTATLASKFFAPVIYTPTSYPAVTTGVGFQPDFTWWKNRVRAEGHILWDVLRGSNLFLRSNTTAADDTQTNGWVANSDGWTSSSGSYTLNEAYVAWNWKANGSGSTNTAGSITSTVSANTTSGFSVVTYTGTGANATVGHGLGVAPSMVICKTRTGSSVGAWQTYHSALGATKTLFLNLTDAAYTNSLYWNNTAPTSSVFSLGGNTDGNGSGYTMVAYCFAPVAGYSAFGSYTGNGSTSGPFIYTGFRPRFVMIKIASGPTYNTDNWFMFDTARGPYNDNNPYLLANTSGAEGAFTSPEMLSNGFCVNTISNALNYNGSTFIYMAFAENPFKYSLAR